DLERDRQTRWRLGARSRRAGSEERLPAQPPDPRALAAEGRRAALVELRSGHGTGGLVRSARSHREGGACRGERAALPACRRYRRCAGGTALRTGVERMTSLPVEP